MVCISSPAKRLRNKLCCVKKSKILIAVLVKPGQYCAQSVTVVNDSQLLYMTFEPSICKAALATAVFVLGKFDKLW